MTTVNDSQPLTIVTKNFINATNILDPTLSKIQYDSVKSVQASVPIRLWSRYVLAVQNSIITLEQPSAESWFDLVYWPCRGVPSFRFKAGIYDFLVHSLLGRKSRVFSGLFFLKLLKIGSCTPGHCSSKRASHSSNLSFVR